MKPELLCSIKGLLTEVEHTQRKALFMFKKTQVGSQEKVDNELSGDIKVEETLPANSS